ncbi:MAG: fused MFS/spermidine synthase [Thermodesulfobacteriota bacterium]
MIPFLYLLFFLSGAAALAYQVVWVRSLQLVFGGSHYAVTAVLSVFMAGLALGSYVFGKRVETVRSALRVYGLLEIGIAVFAIVFLLFAAAYPHLYVPLARIAGENTAALSIFRVLFAVVAMIVPTTLMGGTLPVLTRFASERAGSGREHVSFLYGFNTLGAVAGTLLAGFVLLPAFGVTGTSAIAVLTNAAIGLASVVLSRRSPDRRPSSATGEKGGLPADAGDGFPRLSARLILWGIGISGFCALGYEVLWTRVLSMVVGASVYSFTVMLVSFLTGIALGAKAFGLLARGMPGACGTPGRAMTLFGAVQVLIGLAALVVTYFIRDLPSHAIRIQNFLLGTGISEFQVRQGANFAVAFSHMFVPAFFMGVAFPLAGKVRADSGRSAAEAIGEVSAYNTVGAILGAAASGFLLIHVFGIERSLQLLTLVNIGTGILVASAASRRPAAAWGAAAAMAVVLAVAALRPDMGRMWDTKYFAIYRNNTREAFDTEFNMKDAMENTDVLYYAEGVNATVSSIRVKGGSQAFITNGRIEASDQKEGVQCQYTLGHLPMLLNKNPRRVFVLGTGSGMTLGATSVHPETEELVLAEIEPKVLGVARTFSKYNHAVLDNPKLRIVFNDGRNHLMTTTERYDVITADPIHPWFSGAGYLYTSEYFRLAASRLRPGGIMCQWLPIYELSVEDLKSVVRTFTDTFPHTMLWLTRNDAELVGSNEPIVIDETDLARRIAAPGVLDDLKSVEMGSTEDFLSYFVMGTKGMKEFGAGGALNTDDNLFLEFSAPMSMDVPTQGRNAQALYAHREPLTPYMLPPEGIAERKAQIDRIDRLFQAGLRYAPLHVRFLRGGSLSGDFRTDAGELERKYPGYAPMRFLEGEVRDLAFAIPTLIRAEIFPLLDDAGRRAVLEISAVKVRIGESRAAVIFVDNRTRTIFGQKYIDSEKGELEERVRKYADEVMSAVKAAYAREAAIASGAGRMYPPADATMPKLRAVISGSTGGR